MLHIAHHKHTGKILPHHHTSYRGLFLVMLVLGIALAGMHSVAHASFMDLSAKISGPFPTIPATIENPDDGVTVNNPSVIVSGTCQKLTPSSIVVIYIDGDAGGSTPCRPDSTYSLTINITPGSHNLTPRTLNSTEDFGPDGNPVRVTYTPRSNNAAVTTNIASPPGTDPTRTSNGTGSCQPKEPLQVISKPMYLDFGRFLPAKWHFAIKGGCAPYVATIDWGDGIVERITIKDNEDWEATHAYAELLPYYYVTMRVWDAQEVRASFAIAAITAYIPPNGGGTLQSVDLPFILGFQGTLIRAYIAYVVALALLGLAVYDRHIKQVKIGGVHVFPHSRLKIYKTKP